MRAPPLARVEPVGFAAPEGPRHARRVDLALRAVDVVVAALALAVLAPVLGLGVLAVLMTSGRPVLYEGDRVGLRGRFFVMRKVRTLRPGAEERLRGLVGADLDARARSEVTRVGRLLRHLHVDELPQLVSVLRGDMALVGPRPIRPAFFAQLCEAIPQYWQRLEVRPGMTGLAQLRITRSTTWEEKLAHDLEWIADRSLRLQAEVLGLTAARVLARIASSEEPA